MLINVIKVKLPDSGAYACCPSGDSDYEDAYNEAINKVKPEGFELIQPRLGHKWPKDSEGFTWIPVKPTSEEKSLAYYIDKYETLLKRFEKMKKEVAKL